MTVSRLPSTQAMKAMLGGRIGTITFSEYVMIIIVNRHEEQHFYWSGSSRVEEVMGFQGVCYCHAQGTCLT